MALIMIQIKRQNFLVVTKTQDQNLRTMEGDTGNLITSTKTFTQKAKNNLHKAPKK